VGLDGEAPAQRGGPTNRQPGTAGPGSRVQARAPFSESPGLQSGRCWRAVFYQHYSPGPRPHPAAGRGSCRRSHSRPAPLRPSVFGVSGTSAGSVTTGGPPISSEVRSSLPAATALDW